MSNRPKPTAQKILEGNPGKRPLNDAEPSYPVEAPEMPDNLPAHAIEEWLRVVPQLVRSGIMTRVDRAALVGYVLAWQRLLDAEALIQANGLLVPVMVEDDEGVYIDSGNRKKNPAISIQNEAMRNVRAFGAEFGITPASRTRVKTEKPQAEDPLSFLDVDPSEYDKPDINQVN